MTGAPTRPDAAGTGAATAGPDRAAESERLDRAAASGGLALSVEPMRRRDLRTVLRIDGQEPHPGWSVGLYLAELRRARPTGGERTDRPSGDRAYLVARAGGRVVGFAGALFQPPDAHVTTLAVDRSVRRSGVATRLLLDVVARSVAAGAVNLTLEVRASNGAALALYRRFGLEPAGHRRGYYADTGEDAVVMWGTGLDTDTYRARLAALSADRTPPTTSGGSLQ